MLAFSTRNWKEILRDPFSFIFGLALPVLLLIVISVMQKSISVAIFEISVFTPGIVIFSLSFVTLFSGMLIAKDRGSSYLTRLFASPLLPSDYILGYTLPLIPISLMQSVICFLTAFIFGLQFSIGIFAALLLLIPISLLFTGMGLLLGASFSDKQVGGVSSAIIQVVAFTSGMWFDLDMIGGAFKAISYALPFAHANDIIKGAFSGSYDNLILHLAVVIAYAAAVYVGAILLLRKKMKEGR
jgi:ABC-2 type transport system permease protein